MQHYPQTGQRVLLPVEWVLPGREKPSQYSTGRLNTMDYADTRARQILNYFGKDTATAWIAGHPNGYAVTADLSRESSDYQVLIADRLSTLLVLKVTTCSGSGGFDWTRGACGHCGKTLTATKSGAIRKHKIA